jgi:PKD repeat protein
LKRFFTAVIAFASFGITFGQAPRTCGTMEVDAARRASYPTESLADFENWLQAKMAQPSAYAYKNGRAILTIPVIVHVIHNGDAVGQNENISAAQVNSQIAVLNEDYRRKANTLGYNTSTVGADCEIEFCPAMVDPNGNILAEPGIDRKNMSQASWTESTCESTLKPQTYWDPTRYCNIWTVNFSASSNILGYAQFPNSSLTGIGTNNGSAATDGVVIKYNAFGRVGTLDATYNKGRTATHEVGHWLGLRHIWGDGSNCNATDYCDDTPKSDAANYGCPNTNSCTDPAPDPYDMVQNYMDYTNDACMNIFTQGQKARMITVLSAATRRLSLTTSNVCVIPSTFSYTGRVVDAATNLGVAGASVFLDGGSNYTVTTDANGNFTISNLQEDQYNIYAGKWGYVTAALNAQQLNQGTPSVSIYIVKGYYDDFLFNYNWAESGNATSGKWVRGAPAGTTYSNTNNITIQCNPGSDVAGDFGDQAFVTGNNGGQAGTDDVDGPTNTLGTTTLTSPVMDLTTYTNPVMSYFRWFMNDGGTGTPDDSLVISVTNGTQTVILEKVSASTAGSSQWLFRTYQVKNFITVSNNMKLIVRTFDSSVGHLVEAGLDLFQVKDSTAIAQVKPKTNFSVNNTELCVGDTITLSDLSLYDPDSLFWDISGPVSVVAEGKNPKILLSAAGAYNVQLIAANEAGRDTLAKQSFVTANAVIADFESDKIKGCPGLAIQFTQLASCKADSFYWQFPGGAPAASATANPLVTYAQPGFYDVLLIVKNQYGEDTITRNLYVQVYSLPVAGVTAVSDTNFLASGSVTATISGGQMPFTYLWNDAGNQTAETAVGLPQGGYEVTITDGNGCTATAIGIIGNVELTSVSAIAQWKLNVVPNPSSGFFNVWVNNTATPIQAIDVTDNLGRRVFRWNGESSWWSIDLSSEPAGIYFARFTIQDESVIVKLMKQ